MKEKLGIWELIKNYKFNSIFIKNFIIIILLIILPIIFSNIIVYNKLNKIIEDEIQASNQSLLLRLSDTIRVVFDEAEKLAYYIASDSRINAFLNADAWQNMNSAHMNELIDISKNMRSLKQIDKYIHSVYVYGEKSKYIVTSEGVGCKLETFNDKDWYDGYQKKKGQSFYWINFRQADQLKENGSSYKYMSIYETIPVYDMQVKGIVVINLDTALLEQNINNLSNRWFENFFIIDQNNKILYDTSYQFIDQDIRSILKNFDIGTNSSFVITDTGGMKKVVSVVDSNIYGWKYITVASVAKYQERINQVRQFIILSLIACVNLALILCLISIIKIYNPIRKIISIIKNINEYLPPEDLNFDDKANEVQYILSNIVEGYKNQRDMQTELTKRLFALKQAQTTALQAQINPHFLNNTLETINWKALNLFKGRNDVSTMINHLSTILEISIETNDSLIKIAKEVEHLERYIEIQKIRYLDKFEISWNIQNEILEYMTVKIILQPIVENAIYHGIKPKKEKGKIVIKGYKNEAENNICFEITDDGLGMDMEKVDYLNKEINSNDYLKSGPHMGVRNVNQRIRLVFGDRYGIVIESKKDEGTKVIITIPCLEIS